MVVIFLRGFGFVLSCVSDIFIYPFIFLSAKLVFNVKTYVPTYSLVPGPHILCSSHWLCLTMQKSSHYHVTWFSCMNSYLMNYISTINFSLKEASYILGCNKQIWTLLCSYDGLEAVNYVFSCQGSWSWLSKQKKKTAEALIHNGKYSHNSVCIRFIST